jgi:hypothetical protein
MRRKGHAPTRRHLAPRREAVTDETRERVALLANASWTAPRCRPVAPSAT